MARGQITITEIQDGRSITSVDVQYYLSTSSTSLAGGGWSTTAPDWVDGKYMWSKTVTTYSTGSPTESTPVCITGAKGTTGGTGATGRGVSSIVEEFYLSTSKTTQTGGSWSTTMPTWSPGMYVWTRSLITYTSGTPATATTEPLVSSEWEAVNDIEIGGRNLLKKTTATFQTGDHSIWFDMSGALNLEDYGLSVGDVLTASVYVKTTSVVGARIRFRWLNDADYNHSSTWGTALDKNSEGMLVVTSKIPAQTAAFQILIYPTESVDEGTFEYKLLKLEKGNKPTDWTPAPEDVDADIAGVQTNLDTLQNSLGAMAYEDAVEKTKLGTTIIEGGYLKTGFVDASRIDTGTLNAARIAAGTIETTHLDANAVTADKMAVGTITAASGIIADAAITTAKIANLAVTDAKIQTLSASKLTAGAIDASVIDVTNLNASNITAGQLDTRFLNVRVGGRNMLINSNFARPKDILPDASIWSREAHEHGFYPITIMTDSVG